MILSANNLSKSFGKTVALDGVTCDVGEGATGLLGPNGAGKTTLLRIFLGLPLSNSQTNRASCHVYTMWQQCRIHRPGGVSVTNRQIAAAVTSSESDRQAMIW